MFCHKWFDVFLWSQCLLLCRLGKSRVTCVTSTQLVGWIKSNKWGWCLDGQIKEDYHIFLPKIKNKKMNYQNLGDNNNNNWSKNDPNVHPTQLPLPLYRKCGARFTHLTPSLSYLSTFN